MWVPCVHIITSMRVTGLSTVFISSKGHVGDPAALKSGNSGDSPSPPPAPTADAKGSDSREKIAGCLYTYCTNTVYSDIAGMPWGIEKVIYHGLCRISCMHFTLPRALLNWVHLFFCCQSAPDNETIRLDLIHNHPY